MNHSSVWSGKRCPNADIVMILISSFGSLFLFVTPFTSPARSITRRFVFGRSTLCKLYGRILDVTCFIIIAVTTQKINLSSFIISGRLAKWYDIGTKHFWIAICSAVMNDNGESTFEIGLRNNPVRNSRTLAFAIQTSHMGPIFVYIINCCAITSTSLSALSWILCLPCTPRSTIC